MSSETRLLDVIVVGGGPAGLNGALMLGRSRRSVAVIDSGQPRNAPAEGIHGLLGHEGLPPGKLLELGREEVRRYGVEIIEGVVTAASHEDDSFVVMLADGAELRGRQLLIATGLADVLPDIPRLQEQWGKGVVHCPYCHGWEVRDQAIGVLATGPMSVHQAKLFRQLSDDIVYFTNGTELEEEARAIFAARGVRVVEGTVVSVEISNDHITGLRLSDGRMEPREVIAVATRLEARAGFLSGLGVELQEHPGIGRFVKADEHGRTDVPGLWVAGNVTDLGAQVGRSAAAGAMAGALINAELVEADTQLALAAAG